MTELLTARNCYLRGQKGERKNIKERFTQIENKNKKKKEN